MSTQRSVLVTGGAAGIGLAIATGFAAQGHRVLLADISESVHAAAERLNTPNAPVHGHVTDVGDEAQLLALARRISASVLEKFGVPIEPEPRLLGAQW